LESNWAFSSRSAQAAVRNVQRSGGGVVLGSTRLHNSLVNRLSEASVEEVTLSLTESWTLLVAAGLIDETVWGGPVRTAQMPAALEEMGCDVILLSDTAQDSFYRQTLSAIRAAN
jgi:hypothetical protein